MLQIHSGRGQWSIDNAKGISRSSDLSRPVLDAIHHYGTTVDWQLDCSRPARITDALGVAERSSDFLEAIETQNGYYRIGVSEPEEALGSRSLGREIRNRLSNYLNAGTEQVVLEFSGIGVVSSSFADEVLGKLAAELGELEYRRRIVIDSASPTNRALVERTVALRLESGV
ncbi:STAS-like domain-containing protein [Pseudarthrobacter sp. DSP2-3-2b1]|uniref:STAS-like domain-containing protein n=1 Tax=Pseudarthrobacter sp. DSP2-3-2b1 TaxID=2804661 RepID=UPI003CE8E074